MNKFGKRTVGGLVALAMAAGVGVAVGASAHEAKPVYASPATTEFTLSSASAVSKDGVSVSFAKGDGSTAPTWYAAGLRLYASNKITISCTQGITGITFDWEKQGSKAFASCTASAGSYDHPSNTGEGTWTGSATSIVFTLGSSGQLQLNTFSVTHEAVTTVYATDIAINESISSLNLASTTDLTTTLTPSSPTDSSVGWSSSDDGVLVVSSTGTVTAVGEGTATITANANGAQTLNSVQDTLTIESVIDDTYDYCDVITPSLIGLEDGTSSYTAWDNKTSANASHSSAVYAGKTSRPTGKGISINADSDKGLIVSTSGGLAKKVVVTWDADTPSGRTLNVYGSNSAISLGSFPGSPAATIVKGTSTEAVLNEGDGFRFLGFKSSNGQLLFHSIVIYWDESSAAALDLSGPTAANVGDSVVYTATRSGSSATIDWYVGETKQNSGITVDGDTSTFTYTAGAAGSFEIKAQINGTEVSQTKTLVVSAVEKYTLVTSLTQLTDGNKVLIAAEESSKTYVAKAYHSGDNNVKSVETSVTNNQITKTVEMSAMTLSATPNGYNLKDEQNQYLYAASSSSNHLKGEDSVDKNHNADWEISYDNGDFSIVAPLSSNRHVMQFNAASSTLAFSCYASASQTAVKLYVLDANPTASAKVDTFCKLYMHVTDIDHEDLDTWDSDTETCFAYYDAAKAALDGDWASIASDFAACGDMWDRYVYWGAAKGVTITYEGGTIVYKAYQLPFGYTKSESAMPMVVTIAALGTAAAAGFFLFQRKRKEF